MRALCLAAALLVSACSIIDPRARPEIRYDRVRVHWGKTHVGYQPSIELDITAVTAYPMVAPGVSPFVNVELSCDGQVDRERAFFTVLIGARRGDTFHDTVTMFNGHAEVPAMCDLVASFPGGRPGPVRYCVRGSKVTPGECP
jgi:hypothetical protein